MSNNQEYSVDSLLSDSSFIKWVTSNKVEDNNLWSHAKKELSTDDKLNFEKATKIINKICSLNIDNHENNKSPEFIQKQYIRLLEASSKEKAKTVKIFRLNTLQKYAAAILILVSISSAILFSITTVNTFGKHLTEVAFNTSDILIQTSENEYFKIDQNTSNKWITDEGVYVSVNANEISFAATDEVAANLNNNYKLIVPENKTYSLNLIDGTSVELNSNSKINFSQSLSSKYRNIDLKGEAFFDVAHNKERPFIVQSADMKIEVLGTEFNVSNYQANAYMSTTLIDGSIKVSNPQGENRIIKPGNQAKLFRNENRIIVNTIDVQEAVSWTSNRMIFTDEKIENLIPKLNLWYGKEFVITDSKLKDFRFTGTIKRENELTYFLEILKYTEGINYEITDDQVQLSLSN